MIVTIDNSEVFVGQGGVAWDKDKRTLVLLHGAGMDRTVWVLLARYFARHGFNVVTPDLPGHGASKGTALTTIDDQADFIWSLLDHLQQSHGLPAKPVVMGGHSMGALVATAAAGQYPERTEHLLMFGAGYPMPVGQPLLDAAKADEQAAVDMIAIYSHCFSSQLGHNHVAGISVLNRCFICGSKSLQRLRRTCPSGISIRSGENNIDYWRWGSNDAHENESRVGSAVIS